MLPFQRGHLCLVEAPFELRSDLTEGIENDAKVSLFKRPLRALRKRLCAVLCRR